jgi:hypothetical protein
VPELPSSYLEVHRYDGAAIERGARGAIIPCAVQPRDVAIVHDVARYKFISAPQLRELWWPRASIQAADRRLLKLFRAGYIDRFRPVSRPGTGSYPWTYCLGEAGHQLLQHADLIPLNRRHRPRLIFDFGHVLHELQLNAWVLAYRRALGDRRRAGSPSGPHRTWLDLVADARDAGERGDRSVPLAEVADRAAQDHGVADGLHGDLLDVGDAWVVGESTANVVLDLIVDEVHLVLLGKGLSRNLARACGREKTHRPAAR